MSQPTACPASRAGRAQARCPADPVPRPGTRTLVGPQRNLVALLKLVLGAVAQAGKGQHQGHNKHTGLHPGRAVRLRSKAWCDRCDLASKTSRSLVSKVVSDRACRPLDALIRGRDGITELICAQILVCFRAWGNEGRYYAGVRDPPDSHTVLPAFARSSSAIRNDKVLFCAEKLECSSKIVATAVRAASTGRHAEIRGVGEHVLD